MRNKVDLPPPSHCLLDEDVVEDNEQDPAPGHKLFPPPRNGITLQQKTWAFGLELQHAVHLPGTKTRKPLQIQHKVRQGGDALLENKIKKEHCSKKS